MQHTKTARNTDERLEFFAYGDYHWFFNCRTRGTNWHIMHTTHLNRGRTYGLVSGLGAATSDAIYGCIAGFGLTFISDYLIKQHIWLRLIGGSFLCFLGVKTFISKPPEQAALAKGKGLLSAYASTFFLTITNSMTIASFLWIFAGFGVGSADGSYVSATVLVLGVFMGSALWWLILSMVVSVFRKKLTPAGLRWVNRIAGIILIGFGVNILFSLIS